MSCDATYAAWTDYATKVTQTLYNTHWTFRSSVQSLISKLIWSRPKPLNQWAPSPDTDRGPTEGGDRLQDQHDTYKVFMFNPAVYKSQDIETLRALCLQPATSKSGVQLRDGTLDGWRIISGLAEGSIVCRRLTVF